MEHFMKQKQSDELKYLIRITALFSEIYDRPMTLNDFENETLIYQSKRHRMLTGFEPTNDHTPGKHLYRTIIDPRDISITFEINQNAKKILTKTFKEKPFAKAFLTYNIRIRQASNEYMPMKVIVRPVYFNVDGSPKYKGTIYMPIVQKGYQRFALYTESNGGCELYYSSQRKKFVEHETIELNPIEIEVIKHAAKGYTTPQIAKTMDIKTDLVKYYKKSIYNKYHVSSMSEAVYIALFYELI